MLREDMVDDEGLATAELDELAALLQDRRAKDLGEAEHLAESLGVVLSARGESADDEHDPEGPTLSYEWSRLQALRGETADDIVAVDAALARIEEGTYGRCMRCDRMIGVERLRARPTAELCIACAMTVDG
ncbi:TraR/DksA C4-type zinc finger protein [Leifsonia poae]|uniref:DnaK suppressor protein n=2 Tax=Leifsonia poae TaxID=110933 RepID=A0A9W6H6M2_9MICO|nr:DnaK suppressor protein [Leifsonia poae]